MRSTPLILLLAALHLPVLAAGELPPAVRDTVKRRCLDCHQGEAPAGRLDLERLLHPLDHDHSTGSQVWTDIERMIASGKMPPEGEEPLTAVERRAVLEWYRSEFVLRNGKPHLGVTPLRRLTRYELENTLEDLFGVQLKQPYVVSPEASAFQPSTIEQLYPADSIGESGFDNDAARMAHVQPPLLKLIACIDFALRKFSQDAEARKRFGLPEQPAKVDETAAQASLEKLMDRAFRGHRNRAERESIRRVFAAASHGTVADRLNAAMRAALLSPSFLYRMETTKPSREPYLVSGDEIAVRLSYFLWSSMPDEPLRKAAASGVLTTQEGILAQVTRMLDSEKRIALSENFAGQWLGFAALRTDPAYYHGEAWSRGVYDELLFGFDELIRSNRPVTELIDSDWGYLRQDAARKLRAKPHQLEPIYADIFAWRRSREGLKVERFYQPPRLYRIPDSARERIGGLLTSAGVMRLTSAPNRTNPIRRGVWLMETIMGEHMEPPADIPPLSEAEKRVPAGQSRDPAAILKVHTAQASCRSCHQHIDPLGLGLERFGPRGQWRDRYENKLPIRAEGRLPNGRDFSSPRQLKEALLEHYQSQITDNFVRRMLSYALGRPLKPHDRPVIEEVRKHLAANDGKIGALIEAIVLSDAFRKRQDAVQP